MPLRINKMDKALLLFLLSLLINLISKCLRIGLGVIFYYFLSAALMREYYRLEYRQF